MKNTLKSADKKLKARDDFNKPIMEKIMGSKFFELMAGRLSPQEEETILNDLISNPCIS